VLDVDCDVFIPAARAAMIDEAAASRLSCRMLIEGANGPLTLGADAALREDGVLVVPDLLANTGGVIVSYFEWLQNHRRERWLQDEVNERLEQTMHDALVTAAGRAEHDGAGLRAAAYDIAIERVMAAARLRGRLG
jgi:glutamate dehydrogenase (NAD(P)+)